MRAPEDKRCLQSVDQNEYAVTVSHLVYLSVCHCLILLVSGPDDVCEPPPFVVEWRELAEKIISSLPTEAKNW